MILTNFMTQHLYDFEYLMITFLRSPINTIIPYATNRLVKDVCFDFINTYLETFKKFKTLLTTNEEDPNISLLYKLIQTYFKHHLHIQFPQYNNFNYIEYPEYIDLCETIYLKIQKEIHPESRKINCLITIELLNAFFVIIFGNNYSLLGY